MRITLTLTYGTRETEAAVYRPTQDRFSPHYGDRRRWLVISAPSGMKPADILAAVEDQLDSDEIREFSETFGLHTPS